MLARFAGWRQHQHLIYQHALYRELYHAFITCVGVIPGFSKDSLREATGSLK